MRTRQTLLFLLLPLLACGDPAPESHLFGAWQEIGSQWMLAFKEDTVLSWRADTPEDREFIPWRFIDSTRVLIGEEAHGNLVEATVSGDLLSLNTQEYVRVDLENGSNEQAWLTGRISAAEVLAIAKSMDFDGVARSDLRNAMASQEAFFYDNRTYSPDALTSVGMTISEGVVISVSAANAGGYSVTASHSNSRNSYWVEVGTGSTIEGKLQLSR